jgi:HEAT repeat protein/energy-coupling factor transporter ATP-binding protein EcfA2
MTWHWDRSRDSSSNKQDCKGLARFIFFSKNSEVVKSFNLSDNPLDLVQHQDGYYRLTEAVYEALKNKEQKIQYVFEEYYQLSNEVQLIREPGEVLNEGTCLDLAILFCSLCLRFELLPLLIVVEGHALVAVSCTHGLRKWDSFDRWDALDLEKQKPFRDGLLKDADILRQLVDSEAYFAIECTGFAQSQSLSRAALELYGRTNGFLRFDQALEVGRQQLDRPLKFALDIGALYHTWWRDVCHVRLEDQAKHSLTKSPLTKGEHSSPNLYVPLGLIERKTRPQPPRRGDILPPQGSEFYEPVERYEITREYRHDEFFKTVLERRDSPKSQGTRLVSIGEPGSGKTTLLWKIANWVLEEKQGVSIWIPLAALGENESLEDYLLNDWLKDAAAAFETTPLEWRQVFKELLNSGQVWLMLDGADEMVVRSPLAHLNQQLAQGWARHVRVVLTCRLNMWEADKNALAEYFDIYRNLDFDYPTQVHEFIDQWFANDPDQSNRSKRKRLQEDLDQSQHERVRDLIKNPLRLTLLCRIWEKHQGRLPDTKAGLYQRFVKDHYRWKDKDTNQEFDVPPDQQEKLNKGLGELARQALNGKGSWFRLRESFIESTLGHPHQEQSLFWLALKLGWLNHVGFPTINEENPDEKVYAFFHPTFQEFFAALAVPEDDSWHYFLKHTPRNPAQGIYRIFEQQWKEVFLLWLGRQEEQLKKQKEELIKALVEFKDGCGDYYKYRAYFLAAAGIAEFGDSHYASEIVKQLVRWSFGYFNAKKQKWQTFPDSIAEGAKAAILETDLRRASNILVHLLQPSHYKLQDGTVQRQVPEILSQISLGNSEVRDTLVDLLQSSQDEHNRLRLASILGQVEPRNSEAIAVLTHLLHTGSHEYIRVDAAENLGKVDPGNPEAIAVLIRLFHTGQGLATRSKVLGSLGQIGVNNSDAINTLIQLMLTPESGRNVFLLRFEAPRSLQQIATGNAEAISTLIHLLGPNQNQFTRLRAAWILSLIAQNNKEAITALVHLLNASPDQESRQYIAQVLKQIDPGNLEALTAITSSTVTGLIDLLHTTQNESSLLEAALNLMKIGVGNLDAIRALTQLLHKGQVQNAPWLLRVVESFGSWLEENLKNSAEINTEISKIQITLIKEAIAVLIEVLQNSQNESIRRLAARSLAQVNTGNPQLKTALVNEANRLINLLRHTKDASTHQAAIQSLGNIGTDDPDAIDVLINILRHTKDASTHQVAIQSLENMGTDNPEVIAVLIEILRTSQDKNTCEQAAESLGEFSTVDDFLPLLVTSLKSSLRSWISRTDPDCDEIRSNVIWYCAYNLPYPDFYQAWHSQRLGFSQLVSRLSSLIFRKRNV